MSADRVADLFRELEDPAAPTSGATRPGDEASLERSSPTRRTPRARIMTTEFVCVPSNWTVAQTLDHIRKVERTRETVYAIYRARPGKHTLVHAVSAAPPDHGRPARDVLTVAPARKPITVSPLRRARRSPGSSPSTTCSPCRWWTRRTRPRHRHGRRRDRRDRAAADRGRAEVRRHGGARRALHGDRLRADDPQARRLALRAVSVARC